MSQCNYPGHFLVWPTFSIEGIKLHSFVLSFSESYVYGNRYFALIQPRM